MGRGESGRLFQELFRGAVIKGTISLERYGRQSSSQAEKVGSDVRELGSRGSWSFSISVLKKEGVLSKVAMDRPAVGSPDVGGGSRGGRFGSGS